MRNGRPRPFDQALVPFRTCGAAIGIAVQKNKASLHNEMRVYVAKRKIEERGLSVIKKWFIQRIGVLNGK
jgi:hypothetical protein